MISTDPITKKIQKTALNNYLAFAKVCREHNLRFFAVSGTSIGIELWGGFIPWDDDMDIAMPIEDFEKFRKNIHKYLPEPYAFIEIPGFGGKVYDKNTTFIEATYAMKPERYGGVFIDIVPLIGLPNDPDKRTLFQQELRNFMIETIVLDRAPEMSKISGYSHTKLSNWRKEIIKKYPFGTTKYCTDLSCEKCPLYLTEGFLNPSEAKFENISIPISSKQTEDLKAGYGKLIKIMPKDAQKGHHDFCIFCDLDTPYEHYASSFKEIEFPEWFVKLINKQYLHGNIHVRDAFIQRHLREDLEKALAYTTEELEKLRSSKSFRLGVTLMKPFSKVKALFLNKK